MRARAAYLTVLLLGLTLVAIALQGMRGVDTTLRLAASSPSPSPELVREESWTPPPHDHHHRGCDGHV